MSRYNRDMKISIMSIKYILNRYYPKWDTPLGGYLLQQPIKSIKKLIPSEGPDINERMLEFIDILEPFKVLTHPAVDGMIKTLPLEPLLSFIRDTYEGHHEADSEKQRKIELHDILSKLAINQLPTMPLWQTYYTLIDKAQATANDTTIEDCFTYRIHMIIIAVQLMRQHKTEQGTLLTNESLTELCKYVMPEPNLPVMAIIVIMLHRKDKAAKTNNLSLLTPKIMKYIAACENPLAAARSIFINCENPYQVTRLLEESKSPDVLLNILIKSANKNRCIKVLTKLERCEIELKHLKPSHAILQDDETCTAFMTLSEKIVNRETGKGIFNSCDQKIAIEMLNIHPDESNTIREWRTLSYKLGLSLSEDAIAYLKANESQIAEPLLTSIFRENGKENILVNSTLTHLYNDLNNESDESHTNRNTIIASRMNQIKHDSNH